MRRLSSIVVVLALALWSRQARAQLHADVDLEAGVMQRLLSGRAAGFANPTVGPAFELSGHVAVLPFLRAGAYVAFDLSPVSGEDTRELLSAGLSGRLFSPWPRGSYRAWLAVGFGYAAAHAPAYGTTASASGGYFEVPVGIGASAKLSPHFELIGDLGARFGFGFTGSMYNESPLPAAGDDSFGLFLMLGAAFEL